MDRRWSNHAQQKVFGSRYFFKTKAHAETKADQLRTLRRNEGASALSLSAADRIDAEFALSLLAPHQRRLGEAAEFFIKHLGIFQSAKKVSELVDELMENKLRDGASARYVKDLRSRLNIFAASFPETSVIDLSTAAIDDWLRNLPHSGTTRNNYRRSHSFPPSSPFASSASSQWAAPPEKPPPPPMPPGQQIPLWAPPPASGLLPNWQGQPVHPAFDDADDLPPPGI